MEYDGEHNKKGHAVRDNGKRRKNYLGKQWIVVENTTERKGNVRDIMMGNAIENVIRSARNVREITIRTANTIRNAIETEIRSPKGT